MINPTPPTPIKSAEKYMNLKSPSVWVLYDPGQRSLSTMQCDWTAKIDMLLFSMWWTSSYLFQIDFKVLVLKVPIGVVRRGPIKPKREAPVLWLVDKEKSFTLVVSPRVIVEHSPRLWYYEVAYPTVQIHSNKVIHTQRRSTRKAQ